MARLGVVQFTVLSVGLACLSAGWLQGARLAACQDTLDASATVTGFVTDSSGARLAGAEMTLRSTSTDFVKTGVTDDRGGFVFDHLPAGSYELTCTFPGLISAAQQVVVAAGQTRHVTATLGLDVLREAVTVAARSDEGYHVLTTTSATRMDTPIMDIPQSIQAVDRVVMQDKQIVRLGDAADIVSGVSRTIGYSDAADKYTIRGFLADYTLKNGFKNNNFITLTDVANVERLEILKGPAGILYGKIEPGGVVNVVTKRPLSVWHVSTESVFDNFGSARPSIDVTGPLNEKKTLLVRFNGAFDEAKSARDFAASHSTALAPALTWVLSKRTILSLEGEYLRLQGVPDAGLPAEPILFTLPVNRSIGEPTNSFDNTNDRVSYFLTHQFNERWTLEHSFSFLHVPSINLYRTVYGKLPSTLGLDRNPPNVRLSQKENSGGVYVQDQLTLSRQWKAPVGGRYDVGRTTRSERTSTPQGPPTGGGPPSGPSGSIPQAGAAPSPPSAGQGGSTVTNTLNHVSPHAGLVFQPAPVASVYVGYSESTQFLPFNPNLLQLAAPSLSGSNNPTHARQYESGVKLDVFANHLQATASYFYLTKDGLPNPAAGGAQTETQTSKGVELDVAGQLTADWNAILAYAYGLARAVRVVRQHRQHRN